MQFYLQKINCKRFKITVRKFKTNDDLKNGFDLEEKIDICDEFLLVIIRSKIQSSKDSTDKLTDGEQQKLPH